MRERARKDAGKHPSEKRASEKAAPVPAPTLTTKEEWREFAGSGRPRPPAPPEGGVSAGHKEAYDRERKRYHEDLGILETPALREVHRALLPRIIGNTSRPPGARRGAIVDGTGGVGKTTICTALGRKYERYVRALLGLPRLHGPFAFKPRHLLSV